MGFIRTRWLDLVRQQAALDERYRAELELMRQRHTDELVRLIARHEQEWALQTARYEVARLGIWRDGDDVEPLPRS